MKYQNNEQSSSNIKVLHLLQQSLPNNAGYSIRSHYILKYQKEFLTPYALTRPFFMRNNDPEIYDGIKYYRFPKKPSLELFDSFFSSKYFWKKLFFDYSPENIFIYLFFDLFKIPSRFIRKLAIKKHVDIIHGHTPYIFADMGYKASLKLDIPFIYEVRGFWEDTKVVLGIFKKDGVDYKYTQRRETELMRKADTVITLGEMMKKEILRRRINSDKVHIIPNGVDVDKFKPRAPDEDLKKSLGHSGKLLVGYIGSIGRIEGIEYLIKSLKYLSDSLDKVEIMLVGGCNDDYGQELKDLAKRDGVRDRVHFIGRVPVFQVQRYYSILDIVVIPRINARVNRLVTPLKQLEAMAMEKVVITSDLPALKEMIIPGISGDCFKPENPKALARKIECYALNKGLRMDLGRSARNYVIENHDWKKIAKKYESIYKNNKFKT